MRPHPYAWPGGQSPLWVDQPASAQVPEFFRARVTRQWGYPVKGTTYGRAALLARAGMWGLNGASKQLDAYDQFYSPAEASEAVRPIVSQRCIDVAESDIVQAGAAFELTRIVHVPTASVGIIERVPTMLSVDALDENQVPIFTFANTNGEDPCLDRLVHPDPTVDNLTWTWRVVQNHVPAEGAPNLPLPGPVSPSAIAGDDLINPWSDMRYGDRSRWGDRQQFVVRSSTQVRYWVTFFGPVDRYRVRVGARLAGYYQLTGRRGAALESVTDRIV